MLLNLEVNVKKLLKNQLGHFCSYCRERAVYRSDGWTGMFSCESHTQSLLDFENKLQLAERRVTLADELSWMRV